MIKLVIMYKNIKDLDFFEDTFLKKILSLAKKIPAIYGVNITNFSQQISPEVPLDLKGVQFMIEFNFDSEDSLTNILDLHEGDEMMSVLEKDSTGEMSYLMGKEGIVSSDNANSVADIENLLMRPEYTD